MLMTDGRLTAFVIEEQFVQKANKVELVTFGT